MALSKPTADWFAQALGPATPVQTATWEALERGEHVLLSAPTGSGKTLAAFLWFLDRWMVAGDLDLGRPPEVHGDGPGRTAASPRMADRLGARDRLGAAGPGIRLVYLSPLKALNSDIAENLLRPLEALAAVHPGSRRLEVMVRSGDTPAKDRQRMLRRPPDILVSTPESLNILLTSRGGRGLLGGVRAVIVDEIHSVMGVKRGAHLALGLERLVRVAGEYRRVGVTATVRPLELAAAYLGGSVDSGQPREVSIAAPPAAKAYRISLEQAPPPPPGGDLREPRPEPWDGPAAIVAEHCRRNRTTLIFVNSRRLAEKLALRVNELAGERICWPHHGSLSRELRVSVEERLRAGELKGVVATATLELGIDIGAIDEVILVQPAPGLMAAAQRMGRAGHRVGAPSVVTLIPLLPLDILFHGLTLEAVPRGELEAMEVPQAPLDVLVQTLLAEALGQDSRPDELWTLVRRAMPYRSLDRRDFDRCLALLQGSWSAGGQRELAPRLSPDPDTGMLRVRPGSAMEIWASGGTIPDRGLYDLRLEGDQSLLGSLDEEFVFERRVGDRFLLGNQTWKITAIRDDRVLVEPTQRAPQIAPFWRAEPQGRDPQTQVRLLEVLDALPGRPDATTMAQALERQLPGLPRLAREDLAQFLLRCMDHLACPLPASRRLVMEHTSFDRRTSGTWYSVVHSLRGLRLNTTLAMAVKAMIPGLRDVIATDNSILFTSPREDLAMDLAEALASLRALASRGDRPALARLVDQGLATSRALGALFRENAGRALLVSRGGIGKRLPLWASRRKAQGILASLQDRTDFPLLDETWKNLHAAVVDIAGLEAWFATLDEGISETSCPSPSPLAQDLAWHLGNRVIYELDAPGVDLALPETQDEGGNSEDDPAALLHRVDEDLRAAWKERLYRLDPDTVPREASALVFHLLDRVALDAAEAEALQALGAPPLETVAGAVSLVLPGARHPLWMMEETRQGLSPSHLMAWLRAQVSVPVGRLRDLWGDLADQAPLPAPVADPHQGGQASYSLTEVLRDILAWERRTQRDQVPTLNLDQWRTRLWGRHGLGSRDPVTALRMLMEVPLDPETWDHWILPSRLPGPRSGAEALWRLPDALLAEAGLCWVLDREGRLRLVSVDAPPQAPTAEGDNKSEAPLSRALQEALARGPLDHLGLMAALGSTRPGVGGPSPAPKGTASPASASPGHGAAGGVEGGPTGPSTGASGAPPSGSDLHRELWALARRGRATNDRYATFRQGLDQDFGEAHHRGKQAKPEAPLLAPGAGPVPGSRRRPLSRTQWERERSVGGRWFPAPTPLARRLEALMDPQQAQALKREEVVEDALWMMMDRWGLVCRDLVDREGLPGFWSLALATLRRLELGGQVMAARHVEGLSLPQFVPWPMEPQEAPTPPSDRWLSAEDPLAWWRGGEEGPKRRRGSLLFYIEGRLAAWTEGSLATLHLAVFPARAPDIALADLYLDACLTALHRPQGAPGSVVLQTVNGLSAAESPLGPALVERGFRREADRSGRLNWLRRWKY